ncbi:MAG: secondary thiamine-phosphate synthase enzyme YjbQ [Spirochaetales bacterium]|nr:secondary thiamine-phosphate synthase enzyme YjbQ [Spirochaetales bacterium]
MSFHTISVKTNRQTEFVDISSRVAAEIQASGLKNGMVLVYCPHTTAGLTINENADPDVQRDMLMELNKIVPFQDGYAHLEGNSAAHIKATMTGLSVTIPVQNGRMTLGTWQGIYFCEYDGPRSRKVHIQTIRES